MGTGIALRIAMTTIADPARIDDAPPVPDERPRRILNIIVAIVGIVVTVPAMLAIAVLVLRKHDPFRRGVLKQLKQPLASDL